MENEKTENKILKLAVILKRTSNVLYLLSFVAFIVFTILAIVLPLTTVIGSYTKLEIALIFSGLALYSFFLIGLLWNVKQIFVSIEEENSPFSENVTKYIKKSGLFVIMLSLIPALVQGTLVAILANGSDVASSIQVGGVISGLVLYILSYFFKYGAELKAKEDETL